LLLLLLLLFLSFFLLKIVFHIASLRTWFPELVSAMRISLSASSSIFIYFFPVIPRYPQSSALFRLLCMTRHSWRNVIPVRYERLLRWQQNWFKLGHDSSIKSHQFVGAQDVSRLTAVCCMLLPHNPYRLPQHYMRHVCGSYCSCKHRFVWISLISENRFCLNYMGTVRHWQPFWPSTRVRLIGQCWYLNSQCTPEQPINL
jgi:hypothetical protein